MTDLKKRMEMDSILEFENPVGIIEGMELRNQQGHIFSSQRKSDLQLNGWIQIGQTIYLGKHH